MPKKLPYEAAKTMIVALYRSWEAQDFDEEYAEYLTVPLKDILHCIPVIPSGLASIDAAEMAVSKVTRDHYFSRTRTSRRILHLMRKGILTEPRIIPFLKSRSRVHYLTFAENRKLTTRDLNPPHWKIQYANAGITLTQFQGKRRNK